MDRSLVTINLSAAIIAKTGNDNITSAFYNWAPTVHQQYW